MKTSYSIKYDKSTFKTGEKYLSHYDLPDSRIFINTGFFGSGKTQSIINHCKKTEQDFIIIQPTRALIADTSGRIKNDGIEIKTHLELNKSSDLFSYSGNRNTTIESLIKLDFEANRNHLFVFDEFSTILTQVFSNINDERRAEIFKVLNFIFKNCKVVVFDSLLKEFEVELIYDLAGLDHTSKNIEIMSNCFYNPPKRKFDLYYSQGTYEKSIIEKVSSGKNILIMTDNVSFSDSIITALKQLNYENCHSLCADTRQDILNNRTLNDFINETKPNCLAISPTGFTGLDISVEHFDEVYLYVDNIGISDYRVYIQAIHRLRDFTKPISIYSKNYEFDPTIKTDYLDILSDYDNRIKGLNILSEKILDVSGQWVTRPENKPYEIYLAKKYAWQNQNKKQGLSFYIQEYYSNFKNDEGENIFWFNHIKEENDKLKKDKSEKVEIKRAKLKALPLIDKPEYEKLIRNQSKQDLCKDDKDKIKKYELSRKLGIGHTETNRNDLINEVLDYSINDEKLNKLSSKIESLKIDDWKLQEIEKQKNINKGFDFKPSSLLLEKKIFLDFIDKYKEKEFSKNDFSFEFIKNLELITGSNFGHTVKEEIINRKIFPDLVKRTGYESLAVDYAYLIANGNEETIREVYKKELLKIFECEMNRFDKRLNREFSRVKGSEKREIQREKLLKEAISKIQKKQNRFILSVKNQFSVSHISILSDWLNTWSIKLKNRKSNGNRFYTLDLTLFCKLTGFKGSKNES